MTAGTKEYSVYIGTYTTGASQGIYSFKLDASTGALASLNPPTRTTNPSFLALHPSGRSLYCVNEQNDGSVTAFSRDLDTGMLTYLNEQSTSGSAPCYVSVDASGDHVVAANYGSGSIAAFPIMEGGALGAPVGFVQHEGSSVNQKRQEGPHAHSIVAAPGNRHLLAADLGADRIIAYTLDSKARSLHAISSTAARPGSGPRHFAFHPDGRFAYVINELDSTVTVYTWDAAQGTLSEIQTVPALPAGFAGESTAADIHLHPSGRFLYTSNRGHDSIAIFAVNQADGTLSCIDHRPTLGKTPRNFAIDPSGQWLLAANQDSANVVTFRIDSDDGQLQPTGHQIDVPDPVCVLIAF